MFKIPNFLSKYFKGLQDKEEKDREIQAYQAWHSHRFTQMWIQHFDNRIDALIKEDEKATASSEFEFNLGVVTNRVERKLLRDLIHKLNYKVES